MLPTLYINEASPPARAVMITAKALGLDLKLENVDWTKGEHMTPQFLQLNPQHTVPVLREDDSFVLTDSHAIMGYLVNKYSKDDTLYPKDPKRRALVDQRLYFECATLFSRSSRISRGIFYDHLKEIPDYLKKPIAEAYTYLEIFLTKTKFVAGESITIADFSNATTITTYFRFVPLEESKYPKIHAWLKELESVPYFKEINDKGIAEFNTLIDTLISV